jgi:hypothetical protein
MPSNSEDRAPWWLWPNLLSLDAPIVAVLWQSFLAYRFAVPLRPAGSLVLGLTVWTIYLSDRLLDARKPASASEPARHRFYRRHWKIMTTLLAIVSLADALLATRFLRPVVFDDGLIAIAGVLMYLAVVHASGRTLFPKEVATAFLFTAGTFLIVWATLPRTVLLWPALAFFTLCLANLIAIKSWESRELRLHPVTRWLARTYLLWVPAAVIVCALLGRNEWYSSIAVSASACAMLYCFGRRISSDARRALVDGVLLSPILFLMLR